ncbi:MULTISPECIES: ABC transporter ATP-binding protein [unclassified Mesorhizobium]|uniref:ABC transporter ATP-binding protein n=1 Tax=unclassified Mesorhizobium TaxID=325217 RepID=UPI002414DFEB|nr:MULTISPECIES: ABC transporter ATP-binding protein [unclassified Mesorhizobium]MDG4889935.1 ABC transporter ATP-binding protein [Mesorhizobium sp. WSM4887]MDG4904078.1 ABC transporter ATP-binding protein [Mesorhizobium sp. WSM4962]MDG4909105.1 ABC transporter ATP-binding protein [Mesorhizobium sp. WSM4898]MDG4921729.1 ABC transporter ATP-binding protein [Mesorhizobium sp. WSM4989]
MDEQTSPVLSIRNLSIALPRGGDRFYAVESFSLDVRPREIVCIVGESGSGKSMTSFATMGLLPKALAPTSGKILLGEVDLLTLKERELAKLRGNRIAMIFQEPMTALNPCFSVGDQVSEVFQQHTQLASAERRARTLALFAEVKLPDPERIYGRYPHQLSGGQRQRIVIAMALALDPTVLIADEPTTALDVTTQAQILHLFKDLKSRHGAGIVFVTHDFDVVAEIADRVVVMQHGKIVEQGAADEVLNRPTHAYTRQLISAVPRRTKEGASFENNLPVAMRVTGIVKSFHTAATLFGKSSSIAAVRDVGFEVKKGETLGIVGESGSGKSTLVRCLMRLTDPDTGEVIVDGANLMALSKKGLRSRRKDIQIVFQDPYGSLNPRRTICDQLIEGPTNFGVSKKTAIERARELLRIVRLSQDALTRYPPQFSGGQRQRISIARALMVEPKILIADEAVSALDVSVQRDVLNLLQEIKQKMGLTMIFITHDLRVAAQVSDQLIVMNKGEVVERGKVETVLGKPQHPYTKELLAAMPGQGWEVPKFDEQTTLEIGFAAP